MIACDFCGREKDSLNGLYVNDIIANVSQVSSHFQPGKNDKKASDTMHVFQGQACAKCYEELAKLLRSTALGLMKKHEAAG